MANRSQLSLFVPPPFGTRIESVRRVVDPVQHALIPAHVTLCREDELHGLERAELHRRINHARRGPITLRFGAPEHFGGHGILLPCIAGLAEFQALRIVVLADRSARPHEPHLTLAHPRNPRAPGNSIASAAPLAAGLTVTFVVVHCIEQVDEAPWVVRDTVPL